MDAPRALAEICSAAARVADKWWQIRESNADAAWDDFSFYKGNARWAAGARRDLEALSATRFASAAEVCDAAAELVRSRAWDGDYDEPTAARGELLAAIDEVRAQSAVHERETPRPARGPVAAPIPDRPRGTPYRSAPGPMPPRFDGRRPIGIVFKSLVAAAVLLLILALNAPDRGLVVSWSAAFAVAAALSYGLRVRTVIHEDRVEQGRSRWMRTLHLADVRHVIDDGVDTMAPVTRFSSELASVLLTGVDGTAVRLTRDIPRTVCEDAIARALDAAVRAAEAEIAVGVGYRGLGLVGLDTELLHGFRIGLTVTRSSMPLAEVAEIKPGGFVTGRAGATMCIGEADRVLVALLRARGLVAT
ncbi:Hypothetical protein A7982_09569 [Minicystis rosea]|nr:Hypothetical protein A7982_09569 [Minicystis rosea]